MGNCGEKKVGLRKIIFFFCGAGWWREEWGIVGRKKDTVFRRVIGREDEKKGASR